MTDKATRVLGYIAVVPGGINVLCDGDSCVITGSEKAMRHYISVALVGPAAGYRITKARYGHVLEAMQMGGAYSFDEESFSRFVPLAGEDGIDVVDFTPQDVPAARTGNGIALMRVQWTAKE